MAKKGPRVKLALVCTVCKSQNYIITKNKLEHPEKMKLSKFCRRCRKHTEHKESGKLK